MAALLFGCSPRKAAPPPPPPERPGTSIALAYPVLLIGTLAPTIHVFDDEERLTTTTIASGMGYTDVEFIDSKGGSYRVEAAPVFGEQKPWWNSHMGNDPYRVFLQMKLVKRIGVEDARKKVLDVVRSERGDYKNDPAAMRKAVDVGHELPHD